MDAIPETPEYLEAIPGINVLGQTTTEYVLRDYFRGCIERYRAVASGLESRPQPPQP